MSFLLIEPFDKHTNLFQVVPKSRLERVFYYTARVRYFEYARSHTRRDRIPSDKALHILSLIFHNQPIFSSLVSLNLTAAWPVTVSEASILFSPSLQHLRILSTRFGDKTWSKLAPRQQEHLCTKMLTQRCSSIRQFTLRHKDLASGEGWHAFDMILRSAVDLTDVTVRSGVSIDSSAAYQEKRCQ